MIGLQTVDTTREIVSDDATGDTYWLKLAADAYATSTTYFDANIRGRAEKNLAMYQSRHPAGSKYHTEAYRYRSKLFSPKMRSAIRKTASATAVAFFSSADAVNVTSNGTTPEDDASAQINQAILNYRLDKSIPWFRVLVGAMVDAKVQGIVISKQQWIYKESDGFVEEDRPDVSLIPIENFRFSAAADWLDPIESSPYLIQLIPMDIGAVRERMASGEWRNYSDGEIQAAASENTSSTRLLRQEGADPKQQTHQMRAFDTVWIREYIIRDKGSDVVFWSLGEQRLLTDPAPLAKVYHTNRRPFVMGCTEIEPHKAYPAGSPELVEGLVMQNNEIVNQRLDNVKLSINKRYFGKQGSVVDWDQLRNNVPGGITLMSSFDNVKAEDVSDVTSRAYEEQDRVSIAIDEMLGSFSQGSVANSRNLNETVGGMDLLSSAANSITEYELMIFSQTWVERVLRQLLLLIQTYENDKTILALAGEKVDLFKKFGINEITDKLLTAELTCTVNVGFGATNPQKRIEKLALALQAIGNFSPATMLRVKPDEIIKEVMGAVGYKDGVRFFRPEEEGGAPPEMQQQMQAMQEEIQRLRSGVEVAQIRAQSLIEGKQLDAEARMRDSQMDREAMAQREHIKGDYSMRLKELEAQLSGVDQGLKQADSETKRGELQLQASALRFEIAKQTREMDERLGQLSQPAVLPGSKSGVIMNGDYGSVPHAVG